MQITEMERGLDSSIGARGGGPASSRGLLLGDSRANWASKGEGGRLGEVGWLRLGCFEINTREEEEPVNDFDASEP